MDPSRRAKLIALFEKHRAAPGTPYDEGHFLDFLLANPTKNRAVYDSFRGLRRFNAFLDEVQLEFGICFSMKDRDANYSLDKFVERIAELEASPRGSLASLRNQAKAGPGVNVLVVANLLLVIAALWLRSVPWALGLVAAAALAVNVWFFRFARSASAFHERLRQRIEARQNQVM